MCAIAASGSAQLIAQRAYLGPKSADFPHQVAFNLALLGFDQHGGHRSGDQRQYGQPQQNHHHGECARCMGAGNNVTVTHRRCSGECQPESVGQGFGAWLQYPESDPAEDQNQQAQGKRIHQAAPGDQMGALVPLLHRPTIADRLLAALIWVKPWWRDSQHNAAPGFPSQLEQPRRSGVDRFVERVADARHNAFLRPEGNVTEFVETETLHLAYLRQGDRDGWPVVLLHGFPYDVYSFTEVVPQLVRHGAKVLIPYLRGFGPGSFRTAKTFRSGQQAAVGKDLLDFLDALKLPSAILAGFDWGGRAACIVAALWPERVQGLVSVNGYAIQNIAAATKPQAPDQEFKLWYQYYFATERGRVGLAENRRPLCQLLWKLWSPSWNFTPADFEHSAEAFDNPDFVDVVVHSYRHRLGLAAGDPAHEPCERQLAKQPAITVPCITLEGDDDGVAPKSNPADLKRYFRAWHNHRTIAGVGHNLPRESPLEFARAILDLRARVVAQAGVQ